MDRVKIYIPFDRSDDSNQRNEKRLIRDEIAASLKKSYDVVIIHFLSIFNQSVIEIFVHDVSNEIEFFKNLTDFISNQIGEPILLEITIQTKYIGVMEGD